VSTKVHDTLQEKGIQVIYNSRALRIDPNQLTITNQDNEQRTLHFDMLLLATGAAPPKLLENSDLAKDNKGFIRVKRFQRYPNLK
jgi:NADH dehydrogenase FAD-containing subunit